MKTLQSQIDYEDSIDLPSLSDSEFRQKSKAHREFLKQKPKLGDFIPTDENGVVLENPDLHNQYVKGKMIICDESDRIFIKKCEQYQQAKSKVIFEGFCYFEHQSTFVNSRNNNYEYCVFNYTKNKLGICTYTENKGFHTYFNVSTIEDLVNIEKGITLTDKI